MELSSTQVMVPDEELAKVSKLERWGNTLVITTPEQRSETFHQIQVVKRQRKWFVDLFSDSKRKTDQAHKAVVAMEKRFTILLDKIERQGKAAMQLYDRAEELKRQEEQRKLQAKADEIARREREAYEKRAAKLKTPEKKQEALEAAEAVEATVVYVPPTIQKEKGEASQDNWKAKVVDVANVPRSWMIPNQKALDQYAKSTKGQVPISGVEFYNEPILKVGT